MRIAGWARPFALTVVTVLMLGCGNSGPGGGGLDGTGALRILIESLPAGAIPAITVSNGAGYQHAVSGESTLTGLPVGSYSITAAETVADSDRWAPIQPSTTVQVGPAPAVTTIHISYAAVTGGLQLAVLGLPGSVAPGILVHDGQAFALRVDATTRLHGLSPGTYAIDAVAVPDGAVAYQPQPSTQNVAIQAGNVTNASVNFTLATSALTVAVTGLPVALSGQIVVSGPGGYSMLVAGTSTLTGLPPGTYSISAASVNDAGIVYAPVAATQTVTVQSGFRTEVGVNYLAETPHYQPIAAGFHARTMRINGVDFGYQLFIPAGYDPSQPSPLVLFGHGAGESGSNNSSQLTVGLGPYITAHAATFPAIAVFPQLPITGSGTPFTGPTVSGLLDSIMMTALNQTLGEVHADRTRLYATGVSNGAFRIWDVVYQHPSLFAAFAPISGDLCGYCMTNDLSHATTDDQGRVLAAQRLRTLPIWIYHGGADGTVSPAGDQKTFAAFTAAGGTAQYTEYPGVGHDAWTQTYGNAAFWNWLLAQHR